MPLIEPKSTISGQSGNNSQILIASHGNRSGASAGTGGYAQKITGAQTVMNVTEDGTNSGGRIYSRQPRVNSMDLALEGTTNATVFFDGNAGQNLDAAGAIDVANGIGFGVSMNGSALMWRMLTQDPFPPWNIWGGTGRTLPAEVDVVDGASLGTGANTAATIADALSTTTSPVKLNITLSGSATIGSGGRGIIRIAGTDYADRVISEQIGFRSVATRTAQSKLWYKTVTGVTAEGFGAGTFDIAARDLSAEVLFRPNDEKTWEFWTVELAKGLIPNMYRGLVMQNAVIDIARDSLIALDATFLGRNGELYRNFADNPYNVIDPATGALEDRLEANERTNLSTITGLESASSDVFSGILATLTGTGADIPIALQDSTLTINQEYEYTNVLGSRIQESEPVRGDKRLVTLETTALYAEENDYSDYFVNNQPMENVKFKFVQSGLGQYPYETTFEFDRCQFTAISDPAVDDFGMISQDLVMKAVKGTGLDYQIRSRFSDYPVLPNLRT